MQNFFFTISLCFFCEENFSGISNHVHLFQGGNRAAAGIFEGDGEGFGTLVLRVQPREAQVSIDGQRWLTSGEGEFEVQLPAGRHRIEVELQGFERFSSEVDVRDDGPTPINVSLTRGR